MPHIKLVALQKFNSSSHRSCQTLGYIVQLTTSHPAW